MGCTHSRSEKTETSASVSPERTLVLIQGYHLDENSWNDLILNIPEDRYDVQTLGRIARDENKPASIKTIAIKSCQEIYANSIIVAHSFGGAIAGQMYGYCPQKILKVIYISAIIPNVDELPFARMKNEKEQAAYAEAVSFDGQFITPKDPKVFFKYMDSEVDTNSTTLPRLFAESMNLTKEEVFYNPERFNRLPKAYIITTKDLIVTPETQKMFISDAGITAIEKISTGHFPMISDPKKLADIILKLSDAK